MAKNIFLFTGDEKFLIYNELKKRKESFGQKYGKENIFEFKSDSIDVTNILNSIFSSGLFVTKKLIIIYGIPKDSDVDNKISDSKYKELEQKLLDKFESISDDVFLVFVSFSPDKRTKGFKTISTQTTNKLFSKLNYKQQTEFIKNIFENKIQDSDVDYLLQKVGNDLFALYNESNKIKTYCSFVGKPIDKSIIDNLVYSQSEINVFDILDQMLFDKKTTLNLITQIQKKEYDQFQFMGMLYWGLKNIIQMVDLYKNGVDSAKEMASKLGLHPFVATKNIKNIKKFIEKEEEIKTIFKSLIKIDNSIKTGKLPIELFWLEIKKTLA